MSSLLALCCLPLVKKQKHDFNFFFLQYIIKQLLDSVSVISRIIKGSVRVGKGYQPQPSPSADNPYLDLYYSACHKKLNNCL